jgi:thiamine pyrophosphate-dependent acetolactate synthase large subunit-like protein
MKQIFCDAAPYETPFVAFSHWARAVGLPAAVIASPGELTRDLVDRLLAHGPALLDARIDPAVRIRGGGRVEALQRMSMLQT